MTGRLNVMCMDGARSAGMLRPVPHKGAVGQTGSVSCTRLMSHKSCAMTYALALLCITPSGPKFLHICMRCKCVLCAVLCVLWGVCVYVRVHMWVLHVRAPRHCNQCASIAQAGLALICTTLQGAEVEPQGGD